eukprot:3680735-Rhodomonas_salina.2
MSGPFSVSVLRSGSDEARKRYVWYPGSTRRARWRTTPTTAGTPRRSPPTAGSRSLAQPDEH